MARKHISIDLDLMHRSSTTLFSLKQFDDATIEINTYMDDIQYNPVGNTCKFYVGLNKDVYLQEKDIQILENKVTIKLNKNIISKDGLAYAELEFGDREGTVTSSTFTFSVTDKIGEGASIPGNIEGFIAKYERLIAEFKAKVDSTVIDCNNRVDSKLSQLQSDYNSTKNDVIETKEELVLKFNSLAPEQATNAEVQLARRDSKGKDHKSLQERLLAENNMLDSNILNFINNNEIGTNTIDEIFNNEFNGGINPIRGNDIMVLPEEMEDDLYGFAE